MSDYCGRCRYSVAEKNGPGACPFNYLYWNFLIRHRAKLGRNPRLANAYRTLDKLPEGRIAAVQVDAQRFLDSLEPAIDYRKVG